MQFTICIIFMSINRVTLTDSFTSLKIAMVTPVQNAVPRI